MEIACAVVQTQHCESVQYQWLCLCDEMEKKFRLMCARPQGRFFADCFCVPFFADSSKRVLNTLADVAVQQVPLNELHAILLARGQVLKAL